MRQDIGVKMGGLPYAWLVLGIYRCISKSGAMDNVAGKAVTIYLCPMNRFR